MAARARLYVLEHKRLHEIVDAVFNFFDNIAAKLELIFIKQLKLDEELNQNVRIT